MVAEHAWGRLAITPQFHFTVIDRLVLIELPFAKNASTLALSLPVNPNFGVYQTRVISMRRSFATLASRHPISQKSVSSRVTSFEDRDQLGLAGGRGLPPAKSTANRAPCAYLEACVRCPYGSRCTSSIQ